MSDTIPIVIPDLDLPGTDLRLPTCVCRLASADLRLSVWHRQDGRYVCEGDRLLEMVAGDVVVDLAAPADGRVRRLAAEDDVVTVGQVVGVIQLKAFA